MNSGQGRVRGHRLFWMGLDACTGIYGSVARRRGGTGPRCNGMWLGSPPGMAP